MADAMGFGSEYTLFYLQFILLIKLETIMSIANILDGRSKDPRVTTLIVAPVALALQW